jgi:toxin ParE1/3/4
MKVIITAAAESDLADISDYIAQDNPLRAQSFTDELIDRCEGLADMHGVFPLVPRFETLAIRRRLYRHYLIFYRVRTNTVEVIHVLHAARDYETLLFGEFGGE